MNTRAWFIVNCELLIIWFLLLASIDVLVNKSSNIIADWAWQSVLDCVDRFVVVFNLGDRSASRLESAADEESYMRVWMGGGGGGLEFSNQ